VLVGRPRGWILNRRAFEHEFLRAQTTHQVTRADVASAAGISAQMLGDLTGAKRAGASPKTAAALATALDCPVETLFPEAAGYGSPTLARAAA
jgi:transcriptional regulator with XRE-family HTH domain